MFVFGTPAPQGSKKHVGRGILVESSKKVAPWREAVVAQAQRDGLAGKQYDGALEVTFRFYFTRPKSHYRSGRFAHLLRDDAPDRPTGPPDLSKLIRSTEDALVQAAVIVDDARIVALGQTGKWFCDSNHPYQGALITITKLLHDEWATDRVVVPAEWETP